ncbi:hypothetical protein [Cytobacillus firmus]|uniref:hypothetical protein n=1 Tax=Cytobacillus firmus TaxID=1399 RepID=UPI001C97A835|nr:hypothetical protein [Cytobacillus firmus]MBY6052126.1 hypothetical protein [Cytobacillus firmus]
MGFKRHQQNTILKIIIGLIVAAIILFASKLLFSSSEKQATEIAEKFYSYEQDGEFSSSWELFHPSMKQKFTKGHYIQDRAHVFMNHFGVDTFTYTLGKPEKLKSWRMSKEDTAIKEVYKLTVIQTFKGKYGNFDIEQDIFVGKEKDDWTIMWDYNK